MVKCLTWGSADHGGCPSLRVSLKAEGSVAEGGGGYSLHLQVSASSTYA